MQTIAGGTGALDTSPVQTFGNNHVLDDFNLELTKEEMEVVLGKSGSGKSVW